MTTDFIADIYRSWLETPVRTRLAFRNASNKSKHLRKKDRSANLLSSPKHLGPIPQRLERAQSRPRASDGVQTSRRLCGYDDRLIVAPVVARQNCGQHRGTSVTIPDNSTTEFVRALLMTYPAIAFSGLDSSFWAFARAVGNGGDTFTGPMHGGPPSRPDRS
jgi:hypothetical protein